jgi:alkylation response protein AidB-like acyl-CoA dehydrogenase
LANVVGGLNNGWATAMSTLSFERGTAALALLIGYTLKVEKLLADCPADRPELRMRIARLRAEGASIRATNYRFALDCENAVPDASGSLIRLAFAEFAQRVAAAAIDLTALMAQRWSAPMAGDTITSTRSRKPSPEVPQKSSATSLGSVY